MTRLQSCNSCRCCCWCELTMSHFGLTMVNGCDSANRFDSIDDNYRFGWAARFYPLAGFTNTRSSYFGSKQRKPCFQFVNILSIAVIVQKDSAKRRRVHRRSIIQAGITWINCSEEMPTQHLRAVGRASVFWIQGGVRAWKTWRRRTFDIHHPTISWLSVLIALVHRPLVLIADCIRFLASWFVLLKV